MFKVYVGNLDLRVTADALRPLFEPFGDLDEIIVAVDSKTNKSRGFAIVLFRDPLKGQLAIETLSGRKVNGRSIIINEALKKGKAPTPAPGTPARQGPFGPRFGAARGGVGGRRFSSRNPRRSQGSPGASGPLGPRSGSRSGASGRSTPASDSSVPPRAPGPASSSSQASPPPRGSMPRSEPPSRPPTP